LPKRRRLLKKLPQSAEGCAALLHRRHADRDLVPRRSQSRAEGNAHLCLGAEGLAAAEVRDNRHTLAYLFGAICPDRAVGAAIIMPCVNAEAMSEHLKEISTQVAPGARAVLLCDGAGWHQTGGRLRVPDNITLLPLPSYSPELNPMENVWDYLRSNKLCGLLWDSYEAVVDACTGAWHFLINDPERIRSIGSRIWACVTL